ncbi:MAG: hypothetical protein ACYC7L_04690 [Nitrospirota bacterium]
MQRILHIVLLLAVLCTGVLAPLPVLADEFALRKHPMRLIEAEQAGKRYWYDDRISRAEALALLQYFCTMADDPVPSLYAVPGIKGYYVVSSHDKQITESDNGRRLYLMRKAKGGYEVIDRTPGAGDSYILEPVFFLGRGKTLILAEIGTEYSWGLLVYEIRGKRLYFLGGLDATIEGAFDAADPTPFAVVKHANGRWRVEFSHDLVLDAGGLKEQTIKQKGKQPIVFEHDGKRFTLKADSYTLSGTPRSR